MENGQLGGEWGYGAMQSRESVNTASQHPTDQSSHSLDSILRDRAQLHTLCLDAFRLHAGRNELICSAHNLGNALSNVCTRCELDAVTEEEAIEIWYSPLNFSEFLIIVTEFLTAIHRVSNFDEGAIDDESLDERILKG